MWHFCTGMCLTVNSLLFMLFRAFILWRTVFTSVYCGRPPCTPQFIECKVELHHILLKSDHHCILANSLFCLAHGCTNTRFISPMLLYLVELWINLRTSLVGKLVLAESRILTKAPARIRSWHMMRCPMYAAMCNGVLT